MNNNSNLDANMMNNIKNMVDNGNISGAISQISPEMIQNFSKMLNNSNEKIDNNNTDSVNDFSKSFDNSASNSTLNNIDMETIIKITSALNQMNDKNDPRSNLLYSLKPYLRDEKKGKLDQYANLLNITKIANIMKNDKKETH